MSVVNNYLIRLGGDAMRADWCDDCGARHSPDRRQSILRRLDPEMEIGEILDLLGHFWPPDPVRVGRGRQSQMLRRDMLAIGRRLRSGRKAA